MPGSYIKHLQIGKVQAKYKFLIILSQLKNQYLYETPSIESDFVTNFLVKGTKTDLIHTMIAHKYGA